MFPDKGAVKGCVGKEMAFRSAPMPFSPCIASMLPPVGSV